VDKDRTDRLNLAFFELNFEMVIFAVVTASLFFVAILIGRKVLNLRDQPLNTRVAFFIRGWLYRFTIHL